MECFNEYPENWKIWAGIVKDEAGWKCEECGAPHDPENGWCLTVHHRDGIKNNLTRKNLVALCQRCHLRIQGNLLRQQMRKAREEGGQLAFKFATGF